MLHNLTTLARETSSDKRRDLLVQISDMFLDCNVEHDDAELLLFCDVLMKLLDKVDLEGRAEFAERIADSDRSSRELHLRLAEDDIRVAEPILIRSPKLDEDALAYLSSKHGQMHLLAISRRDCLSSRITDVLIERGEQEVLDSVTRNFAAEISHHSFARLALCARSQPSLKAALSFRADLPISIAERLMKLLPPDSRDRLVELIASNQHTAGAILHEAGEQVRDTRLQRHKQRLEARQCISGIRAGTVDLSRVLIDYADADRVVDLALVLAEISGLQESVTTHSLLRVDVEPLGMLLRTVGCSADAVEAIGALRCRRLNLPNSMSDRLLALWHNVNSETAARAVRFAILRKMH
jgi:uncharacterized protein (DUF2336 family)